jgi:hypothetical protein
MTKGNPKNVAASVRQRLQSLARERKEDLQLVLSRKPRRRGFPASNTLTRLTKSAQGSGTPPVRRLGLIVMALLLVSLISALVARAAWPGKLCLPQDLLVSGGGSLSVELPGLDTE